ncbi:hypothetical protein BMS3Bbin03_00020 [bacterium BMS3Bbin03]|nr:hypothetical protein BMS3Bbin03_00020 [bacterium BMS3Bbin03]
MNKKFGCMFIIMFFILISTNWALAQGRWHSIR